jgi:starvation-inducible outer membrane lipoprotein
LPSKYIEQAEPGVTLARLTASPQQYRDKVVIMGGVLVEERQELDRLWLRLKNRPLDENYHPHRPVSLDGPESGHYWVTAANREQLPARYRKWARMTVVGRVVGATRGEPVLMLMYVRGWGLSSGHDDVWEESFDPGYLVTVPEGLHGEFQAQ